MTTTALEPWRDNIIDRYSMHDLTPDQVVRYLNSTGIHTEYDSLSTRLNNGVAKSLSVLMSSSIV